MALALDEPKDTDDVHECDGYSVVVEKELAKQVSYMSIKVTYMGFQVDSDLELGAAGGGCGGSCSAGTCG